MPEISRRRVPDMARRSQGGKTQTPPNKGNRQETQLKVYQDSSPLQGVLRALEEAGSELRESGGGYQAQCPAHRDRRPSLSITEKKDGKVVLHCHAGCRTEHVLAALGLTMADLFPDGQIEETYPYTDEDGNVLFQVVRRRPKGFSMRRPDSDGDWINDIEGVRRLLFRLPEVLAAKKDGRTIFVVEGEKDVLALEDVGEVATCNPGGAGKWLRQYDKYLRGAEVIVVRDDDVAGKQHARSVVEHLSGVAKSVRLVRPAEGCHDAAEHLDGGHGVDEFVGLRLLTPVAETKAAVARKSPRSSTASKATPKASTRLVKMMNDTGEFFRCGDVVYATIEIDGHTETWGVRSKHFKGLMAGAFYDHFRTTVGSTAIDDALRVIEAETRSSGPERLVHLRVAEGPDGAVYVDLVNEKWEAVKVTKSGWKIVTQPPVHFIRKAGMQALPHPQEGGTLDELRYFINVDDEGYVLLSAWLVGTYCPWGPYAILELQGEHGSAKSTTGEGLQNLSDPNRGKLRVTPGSARDLAISAQNGWLLAFDNLSWIEPWLSDALCRISTGGGMAVRTLYTDDEEQIFFACRPILMNGIEELGTRPDLLDRTLMVTLPAISPNKRKDKRTLRGEFEAAWPRLFGSVLDAVSLALRNYSRLDLPDLERMADFVKWSAAASPAFGGQEALLDALKNNAARLSALSVESNPVADAIMGILKEHGRWESNATELLDELNLQRRNEGHPPSGWPKGPRALAGMLRRLAPTLRSQGFEVDYGEHGRIWTLDLPKDSERPRKRRSNRTRRPK